MSMDDDPAAEQRTPAGAISEAFHQQADQLVDTAQRMDDRATATRAQANHIAAQADQLRERAAQLHQHADQLNPEIEEQPNRTHRPDAPSAAGAAVTAPEPQATPAVTRPAQAIPIRLQGDQPCAHLTHDWQATLCGEPLPASVTWPHHYRWWGDCCVCLRLAHERGLKIERQT